MLTRNEYLHLGADLSVRDESYLEDCFDEYVWSCSVPFDIMNCNALIKAGEINPEWGIRCMLELSRLE